MPLSCEESLRLLLSAWQRGRLSHAHILAGDVEVILRNVLTPLMREMLGAEPQGHADVHLVQPKSKSRQIVVEDIEDLIVKLNQTTFHSGGYRFAILLYADRMNTVAANKFLKTLEEPFPRTHIFLITEQPYYLLPTVRSRCAFLGIESPASKISDSLKALVEPLQQRRLSDVLEALLWARNLEKYLQEQRAICQAEVANRFSDELKLLEAAARDQKLEEMEAATSALYVEKRAELFQHLIASAVSLSVEAVRLLEDAHSQLLKNLQDAVVLEHLALRISDIIQQTTEKA